MATAARSSAGFGKDTRAARFTVGVRGVALTLTDPFAIRPPGYPDRHMNAILE